jgi:hypothetical protein
VCLCLVQVAALDLLGGLYGDNTADARRGLRGLLESQHLAINQQLIDAFAPAQEQLAAVEEQVGALARSCDEIGTSLAAAQKQTELLLEESQRLERDKLRLDVRQQVVGTFLERFQISKAQEDTLRGGAIDAEFLDVLQRLQQIRVHCSQLLRTR